jgi:hypothetical protein
MELIYKHYIINTGHGFFYHPVHILSPLTISNSVFSINALRVILRINSDYFPKQR